MGFFGCLRFGFEELVCGGLGAWMNASPTVFAQIMGGVDATELSRAAARYPMFRVSKSMSVYDHFAAMVFAQLTYRESLRAIETCLG